MAKSLRSKSKLRAKSVKRAGEFQNAVNQRTQRLFEKSKEELIKQKIKEQEEDKTKDEAKDDDDDAMKVDDDKEAKKVSTSGYRTARHHLYKKSKKSKKSNNMSFKKSK